MCRPTSRSRRLDSIQPPCQSTAAGLLLKKETQVFTAARFPGFLTRLVENGPYCGSLLGPQHNGREVECCRAKHCKTSWFAFALLRPCLYAFTQYSEGEWAPGIFSKSRLKRFKKQSAGIRATPNITTRSQHRGTSTRTMKTPANRCNCICTQRASALRTRISGRTWEWRTTGLETATRRCALSPRR